MEATMRWIRDTLSVLGLSAALLALAAGFFGCTSADIGIAPEPFPPHPVRTPTAELKHQRLLAQGAVEIRLPAELRRRFTADCQEVAMINGLPPESGSLVGVYRTPDGRMGRFCDLAPRGPQA